MITAPLAFGAFSIVQINGFELFTLSVWIRTKFRFYKPLSTVCVSGITEFNRSTRFNSSNRRTQRTIFQNVQRLR